MSRLIQATVKPLRINNPMPSPRLVPVGKLPALALAIYADLPGKPYVADARGPESFDCVGLALEIARRLGKQVPDYVSSEAELHAQLGAGAATLADCPQIAQPEPGCVVLLRMSASEHHLAFMVDEHRMIHTLKGVGCVIERINSQLWQRKVIGYYSLAVAPLGAKP
jgi:cell wall-associated NlpC family hydrolase